MAIINQSLLNDYKTKSRFISKIKILQNGCWEWTGSFYNHGYGQFFYSKNKIQYTLTAHRAAWMLFMGSIPYYMKNGNKKIAVIDHLCRNQKCVNPLHLEPVSDKINILRGNGISAINSRKIECPKGHPYDKENTYFNIDGKRQCNICRLNYNNKKNNERKIKRLERIAKERKL